MTEHARHLKRAVCICMCVYEMQPADCKVRVVRWDNSEITTKSHQRSGWKPCHEIFHFSQSTPQWVFARGWLTEAAARAHGILTTTNLGSSGYLNIATVNTTEHNHWSSALTVIYICQGVKYCMSQTLLFSQIKSKWL